MFDMLLNKFSQAVPVRVAFKEQRCFVDVLAVMWVVYHTITLIVVEVGAWLQLNPTIVDSLIEAF